MRTVTLQDKIFHLTGKALENGKLLPDVTLQTADLKEIKISSLFGSPLLVLTVPSIDTSVCSLEGKTFNQRLMEIKTHYKVLLISRDLPFAQKRWCGIENISKLEVLSDAKRGEVGSKWGLEIEELGVLARSYLIVDEKGFVNQFVILPEITSEPPYEEIIKIMT